MSVCVCVCVRVCVWCVCVSVVSKIDAICIGNNFTIKLYERQEGKNC